VTRLVDNWVAARVEFAQRLVADVAQLAARLGDPAGPGAVREVEFGAGDSHRDGRSVRHVLSTLGRNLLSFNA
jgi:lantibiotic modifying enzyme